MKREIHKCAYLLNAVYDYSTKRSTLNASSGFTILFAVLVASLLFSLGLAIAHMSIREILLSVAGKESEYAFFSADTGIECALYWDINAGKTELVFPSAYDDIGRAFIGCNGAPNVSVSFVSGNTAAATSTFTLDFTPKGCAIVTVGKTVSGFTVIESRGRNDCGVGPNPARVERALRVRY
ncbi:MAG TPA: hypothetical protein DEF00_03450 [Candidatus Taylorbacteria bacterium]|nr:MAG: hypothetical protein UY29_C0005G0016 [Parcubacteria group bacterium GW2011_GWC2_48_17]HBV01419.1 hypothetical protein [Candidatus Taylorbacteria bacterium]